MKLRHIKRSTCRAMGRKPAGRPYSTTGFQAIHRYAANQRARRRRMEGAIGMRESVRVAFKMLPPGVLSHG